MSLLNDELPFILSSFQSPVAFSFPTYQWHFGCNLPSKAIIFHYTFISELHLKVLCCRNIASDFFLFLGCSLLISDLPPQFSAGQAPAPQDHRLSLVFSVQHVQPRHEYQELVSGHAESGLAGSHGHQRQRWTGMLWDLFCIL